MKPFLTQFTAFLILLLVMITGCTPKTETSTDQWGAFTQRFIDEQFSLLPTLAVSSGKHEYDGMIPDLSKAGLDAWSKQLHDFQAEAQGFDTTSLNDQQKFEREYLLSEIDDQLFSLEVSQAPYKNPTFYFGMISPDIYLSVEYAPLETRFKSFIKYLGNFPKANAQIKENLSSSDLPKTFVNMGTLFFGGLASYFTDDVPGIFISIENDTLQEQFVKANEAAIASAEEMNAWFKGKEETAGENFALGADVYKKMLWYTERVDISLADLKAIGEKDLQRNYDSLIAECKKFAPGKTVEQCLAMIDANKPPEGPVQAARNMLAGLKAFVGSKNLVSIPGTEECLVAEAPPYQQSNSAYIIIPGPFDKGVSSTYYIAPPIDTWTEEEKKAYIPSTATLLATTIHEVWPGHFLQFLHANRAASKFGQIYPDYAFVEGWAHYSEELMFDVGYSDDPAMKIGQLTDALLRNVRLLSSIGLHTEGMSVEESEKMFREKAFQDPGNARQQAARGTYDPGYLNYTLGKLMIMKLRADWVAEGGDSTTWKTFHDQLLSYGGPPVPLVRKAMLKEKKKDIL